MNVTDTPQQASTTTDTPITDDGNFNPIPTRMKDLAPLVVEPDDEVKELVHEQLGALENQILTVHAVAAEAYMSQASYEQALRHVRVAVEFSPGDIQMQNQLGFLQYLTGDDDGAIQSFMEVIAVNPEQPDALCNLGMVTFGQGKFEDAQRWFTLAVHQIPDDAELWNNLGASVFQSGKPQEAVPFFRKCLELDPANEDAKANLAAC